MQNETFSQTLIRYLEHQKELYGSELYISPSWGKNGSPMSSVNGRRLEALRVSMEHCAKCALANTRKKLVFGTGNIEARVMLIGEAPGVEEDLQGEPFVGSAGQLLNKILSAIGFQREEVYITNVVKCHPSMNRDPLPEEVKSCLPYLEKQIEWIRPQLLLVLGRIAGQGLLNVSNSIQQMRGKVHTFRGIPMIVTYHPAALLRNPAWKVPTWEDVQRFRELYDKTVGDKPPWQRQKA